MAQTMSRYQKLEIITGLRKAIRQDKKRLASRHRKLRRLQNSLAPDPFGQNPERLIFCLPDDKRESKVIKILAARLRDSRELCGHGLRQAAQLLNVAPEDLRRIEGGVNVDHVPLWLVRSAAEVYNVPVDFLFGLIDDFDGGDSEVFRGRNLLAALQRQQLEESNTTASEQIRQDGRFKEVSTAVVELVMRVQSLSEVVNRFMQINPTFQDMAGSAPVLRQTKLAENAGLLATKELTVRSNSSKSSGLKSRPRNCPYALVV
jgi:hypothetical protein